MKHRALLMGLGVTLALSASCTGELTPYDPRVGGDNAGFEPNAGDPLAQEIFTQQVQPILNVSRQRGSCAQCHQADLRGTSPFFMGTSSADNFAAILRYPNLIVPGNAEASRLQNYGSHTGDALTGDEADVISNWILML